VLAKVMQDQHLADVMQPNQKDITQALIPLSDILSMLLEVFSDLMILNTRFDMLAHGETVIHDLGYSKAELRGRNISMLSNGLQATLAAQLANGFFPEQNVRLYTKKGDLFLAGLSGFQSGLFSDINGLVVLRFRNLENVKSVYKRLEAKTEELDQFIYQASHDLRGPLATIKGLANVMKTAKGIDETEFIVGQIERFAVTLDDKLHKLAFLASSGKEGASLTGRIDFQYLESKIRETIAHHSAMVKFTLSFNAIEFYQTNDLLLYSLLTNLFSFIASHAQTPENALHLELVVDSFATEILIEAKGFSVGEETRIILVDEIHGYAELLKHPDLIYYYAAHKIVMKVQGAMDFNFLGPDKHRIKISFPHGE
jgi:signal transduction histidine kinase